jgi:prepilin-type N-terminal cleavage/methylation domain-containing protein
VKRRIRPSSGDGHGLITPGGRVPASPCYLQPRNLVRLGTPSSRLLRLCKQGLTLIEVVVGLAIVAVVAAIVFYAIPRESPGDRDRYNGVATDLYGLAQAIAGNEPTRGQSSFRWVIGAYPSALSQLTTPVTTANTNICGATFSAAQVAKWLNPFWPRVLLTGGTILASGFTLQDALVRLTSVPTPGLNIAGTMALRFSSVTLADAQGLDAIVDDAVSGTTGTLRYAATDPTSVDYYILISGC